MEFIRLSGIDLSKLRQHRKHIMHGNIADKKPYISVRKNKELKLFVAQFVWTEDSGLVNKAFQATTDIKTVLVQADRFLTVSAEVPMLHDF
jgi:hypothetical protein